jgi:hypothetical protein
MFRIGFKLAAMGQLEIGTGQKKGLSFALSRPFGQGNKVFKVTMLLHKSCIQALRLIHIFAALFSTLIKM